MKKYFRFSLPFFILSSSLLGTTSSQGTQLSNNENQIITNPNIARYDEGITKLEMATLFDNFDNNQEIEPLIKNQINSEDTVLLISPNYKYIDLFKELPSNLELIKGKTFLKIKENFCKKLYKA